MSWDEREEEKGDLYYRANRSYNPNTDKWTQFKSLNQPVAAHQMINWNGHLLLMGGLTDSGYTNAVWEYSSNEWIRKGDLPEEIGDFAVV